jgi:hypothetical protein
MYIFRRDCKISKVAVSFVMSVHMEQPGYHWADFDEFDMCAFSENLSTKFKFH